MGQYVEGMKGYVRESTPADDARPISVFDMQPAAPVNPVAKKAADPEGSKK